MAQKRMFSLAVTDTDAFLDMPLSAQALYFHLGMHGDDDGFVASPRKIARAAGCNNDDIKVLVAKNFLIPFDSGVVVIRDWRVNNTLKNDRYHETIYRAEKAALSVDETGRYQLGTSTEPGWNQSVSVPEPEHNLTKHNITKQNITEQSVERAAKPPRASRFTPPTVGEVRSYCLERGNRVDAERFVDFYQSKGWMIGKSKMKDWKAAIRSWERGDSGKPAALITIQDDAAYKEGWD